MSYHVPLNTCPEVEAGSIPWYAGLSALHLWNRHVLHMNVFRDRRNKIFAAQGQTRVWQATTVGLPPLLSPSNERFPIRNVHLFIPSCATKSTLFVSTTPGRGPFASRRLQ